ncbi:unnamed protein product [Tuber aestivum]|uniref:Uncharacterized protein n=1 Tax=Tuber aestivum TaxID=59557 RepID=A0A292PYC2_9PEZI|nr:unnamed protein product [Tuber aestivum]
MSTRYYTLACRHSILGTFGMPRKIRSLYLLLRSFSGWKRVLEFCERLVVRCNTKPFRWYQICLGRRWDWCPKGLRFPREKLGTLQPPRSNADTPSFTFPNHLGFSGFFANTPLPTPRSKRSN